MQKYGNNDLFYHYAVTPDLFTFKFIPLRQSFRPWQTLFNKTLRSITDPVIEKLLKLNM